MTKKKRKVIGKVSYQFNNIEGVSIGQVLKYNAKTAEVYFPDVPGTPTLTVKRSRCKELPFINFDR